MAERLKSFEIVLSSGTRQDSARGEVEDRSHGYDPENMYPVIEPHPSKSEELDRLIAQGEKGEGK